MLIIELTILLSEGLRSSETIVRTIIRAWFGLKVIENLNS